MSGVGRTQSDFNYQQIAQQPEAPQQSGWSKFGQVLGDVGRGIAGNVPILGNTLSKVGVNTDFSKQEELIKLQLEIQKATQTFSMISNINKAKHEASMTAVRNFK